jgi:hypothetical protein
MRMLKEGELSPSKEDKSEEISAPATASSFEADELATFNPPAFWIEKAKDKYSKIMDQEFYNRKAYGTVCSAVQRLKEIKQQRPLNKEDFRTLLSFLAVKRKEIAMEADSIDKEFFGVERKPHNMLSNSLFITDGHYNSLKKTIKGIFVIAFENHFFGKKSGKKVIENGNSRFTIELLSSPTDLEKYSNPKTYQDRGFNAAVNHFTLKKQLTGALVSGFIAAYVEIKVNNQWIPVSAFYSHYYSNSPENIITPKLIERFKEISDIELVHTDPIHIPLLLDNVADFWVKAMNWDGKDTAELKASVAEMQAKFSQTMFVHRGTAAIGEWLEKITYKSHEFKLTCLKDDVLLDLEILKQPFMAVFIAQYVAGKFWKKDPTSEKVTNLTIPQSDSNLDSRVATLTLSPSP